MTNKLRRRKKRSHSRTKKSRTVPALPSLRLENLEQRVLLDVAGWWDELGLRSGSGGGITSDFTDKPGEAQLVLSGDGDPVAIWIDGTLDEFVETPIPFHFQSTGNIYARQFAGENLGWWDLLPGSGDTSAINTTSVTTEQAEAIVAAAEAREVDNLGDGPVFTTPASQMAAASGPNGEIVVVWVADAIPMQIPADGRLGLDSEIYAKMFDGTSWIELDGSARGGGVSNDGAALNEKPDVVISDGGEIFISYTAVHPISNQREIVVKQFTFDLGDSKLTSPPAPDSLAWTELVNADVGEFGESATSGVSADLAKSFDAAIALGLDNNPIIAWTNVIGSDQAEIFLKKWDGDSWEELGTNSASGSDVAGVSSDEGMSIQPDLAVAPNGDIIVTWVNWANWDNYDPIDPENYDAAVTPLDGGQAGIFVKSLQAGVWSEYDTGSTTAQGIASAIGWYYQPEITTTSTSRPFITWQGYEADERFAVDRDNSAPFADGESGHTPGFPDNDDEESPLMSVFASRFDGSNFNIMPNPSDFPINPLDPLLSPTLFTGLGNVTFSNDPSVGSNAVNPIFASNFLPALLVGPNDELILAYTWTDTYDDLSGGAGSHSVDKEIYVQQWDSTNSKWTTYGRGSDSQGNDVFGGIENATGDIQLGLVDFDNDSDTEHDILLANGKDVFLYSREANSWSPTVADTDYGYDPVNDLPFDISNPLPNQPVFDLRGDPEPEFGVVGSPLLAYLDTDPNSATFGLPFVKQWTVASGWSLVGGPGPVGTTLGNVGDILFTGNTGISVQAGPDGTILVAYVANNAVTTNDETITRLWDPAANAGAGAWADPVTGQGTIPARGALAPAFYANFDGTTFTDTEVTDVGFTQNDDGTTTRDPEVPGGYEVGQWYFDIDPGDTNLLGFEGFRSLITGTVVETAGVNGVIGPPIVPDDGFFIGFEEQVDDDDSDDDSNDPSTLEVADVALDQAQTIILAGQLDHHIQLLADSQVIIELAYQLETTTDATGKLDLFLVIDGNKIDFNPATAGVVDPIDTVPAAGAGNKLYAATSPITIDTTNYITQFQTIYSQATLPVGKHTVSFLAEYTSSGLANGATPAAAPHAFASLDNLAVYQRIVEKTGAAVGTSKWKINPADIGGNDAVGPDPGDNATATYDFQANFNSLVAIADRGGTQASVIENITQQTDGDMVISFRYRISSDDPTTSFSVYLDDLSDGQDTNPVTPQATTIQINQEGNAASIVLPNWITSPTWAGGSGETQWWNLDSDDPEYTFVRIDVPNLAAGSYDIIIQLNSGPASTVDVNLWLDDISVLTTQPTDTYQPMVTLLPNRNFGVGINAVSPNLQVYHPDQTDPFPDGNIVSFAGSIIPDGYINPHILELDTTADAWSVHAKSLNILTQVAVDFLGFNNPDNLQSGGAAPADFPNTDFAFAMPAGGESYFLEDLTIGPNSVVWTLLQHAESDWTNSDDNVDTGGPDGEETFFIHPSPLSQPPTGGTWSIPRTPLDFEVWSWDPFVNPLGGTQPEWVDAEFPLPEGFGNLTNIHIVGSNAQLPTVAFSTRAATFSWGDGFARQLETDDTWGILGTESVQNAQGWSALAMLDLIVNPDGSPIVGFGMTVTTSYVSDGLREFRPDDSLPAMRITENTGLFANDNRIDFGTTVTEDVDRAFTISNDGSDDLLIYGVEIGGIGTLGANPFALGVNTPPFPIRVEPGQNSSINVKFTPAGVPAGEYSAVLLINNSDPQHPTHPASHFYDMNLDVEVLSEAEINVTPEFLTFENTTINTTSSAESFIVTNEGDVDSILTIDQWYFNENNYRIVSVTRTVAATSNVSSVSLTNAAGNAADDVPLASGDTLEFEIVFEPDEVEVANEILYIASDDSDESLTSVFLTGLSTSGANIVVEQVGPPVVIVLDQGTLDFGSVITGNSAIINLEITNDGTTDLTISGVQDGLIVTVPLTENIVLAPGASLLLPVTYEPTLDDPENPNDPVALEDSIFIFSDDPDTEDKVFEVAFIGLAVPAVPLISTSEVGSASALISSRDFGPVPINTSPAPTLSFQINNIGGADLTIESFTVTPLFFDGGVPNPFSVSPDLISTTLVIPVGGPAEVITVTFDPTFAGDFSNARLNIASTGINKPVAQISLLGSVTNPLLEVTDSQDDATDQEINFGLVGESFTSSNETITLRNTGNSDLTITNWTVADPDGVFTVEPFKTPFDLSPNEERVIDVVFTPNAAQVFQATVTVSSNDPNNLTTDDLTVDVNLLGTGVAPGEVGLDTLSLEFTPANVNPLIATYETALQTFTITNNGDSDLVLKGIIIIDQQFLDPADESEFSISPFNLSIIDAQAGQTRNRLNPDDPSDDIFVAPALEPNEDPVEGLIYQQLVSVNFEPTNSFNGTVFVKIITTDLENNTENFNYVTLSGESILAIPVGNLNGLNMGTRSFFDSNNNLVQVKLTGGGHALVVLENGFGSGSDIARIELIGTTDKSKLTVSTKGQAVLGQIIGGSMKNITLKNIILDGDMDNNSVEDNDFAIDLVSLSGRLKLGDITDGADIRIADTPAKKGAKITAANIDPDTEFRVEGDVKLFQATNFRNGKFSADNAESIKITGSQTLDSDFIIDELLGKFSATKAQFTGALRAQELAKASFFDVKNAAISVRNQLGAMSVRTNLVNSLILAGFDLGSDGRLGGGDDTLNAGGLIGSVKVRGVMDDTFVAAGLASADGNFFNPTAILPGTIKKVQFGNVNVIPDGTPFGVAASTTIGSVKAFGQSLGPGQSIGEFQVQLI